MIAKKKTILTVMAIVLILSGIFFCYRRFADSAPLQKDLERFSQESYDSVFLSMHFSAAYTPEIFSTYFALETLVSSYEIQTPDELRQYFDKTFSPDNTVSHVFLVLDPDILWKACRQNENRWDKALQHSFFDFVSAHPDTQFEVSLPYPSLAHWVNTEQSDMEETLSVYHDFIAAACNYANIRVCYMGFEQWLISNPDNYISDFTANEEIARFAYLTCFYDDMHRITSANDQAFFDILREQVIAERTSPTIYPDLSDCCFVFFGDSIMAYGDAKTITTPGYIAGFSDASTYNYAVGGTAAGEFSDAFSGFLSADCTKEEDGTYCFTPENEDISKKKLYFFLLYGTNDYFSGNAVDNPENPYDVSTYAGVMRDNLKRYMPLFPDAQFILITPGYTSYFSNGTERKSDVGGILTDYVDAAVAVADEFGLPSIDNYHDLGIDASNIADYSSDGCHPNEDGRLLMAKHIIDFVDNLP